MNEPGQASTLKASRTSIMQTVLLLAGIFFLSCLSRFGMGPLMPVIEEDLKIGHAAAGSVFFFTSFGYCLGLLASNALSARINYRWTVVVATLAIGGALLGTSLGASFPILCLGMAIVGFASGLYLPSGVATITLQVAPINWGKAFAVHELAPNASFILAPLLIEMLLKVMPWQGLLALMGGIVMVGGGLFAWSGRGSGDRSASVDPRVLRAALVNPSLWVLMLLFSFAIAANIGVFVMLPLYLTADLGMDRSWANALVGLSRVSGLGVVLAAGLLADSWGAQRTIFLGLSTAGVLTALLGILSGPTLLVAVFLQPVMAACFFPAGFALLSRFGPLGVSLVIPMAFLLGAGAIPAMMGAMADAGAFSMSMLVVGFMIAACGVLSQFVAMPEAPSTEC